MDGRGHDRPYPTRSDRIAGRAGLPVVRPDAPIARDFLGYVVLIKRFDGDLERWREHLEREASAEKRRAAAPFFHRARETLRRDPSFLDEVRHRLARFERANGRLAE